MFSFSLLISIIAQTQVIAQLACPHPKDAKAARALRRKSFDAAAARRVVFRQMSNLRFPDPIRLSCGFGRSADGRIAVFAAGTVQKVISSASWMGYFRFPPQRLAGVVRLLVERVVRQPKVNRDRGTGFCVQISVAQDCSMIRP